MTDKKPAVTLALVGCGPRGLGALEALAEEAMNAAAPVDVKIFDTADALGAGPNFHPHESDLCSLNIPVRILDIDPPAILREHIDTFQSWSSENYDPDAFPPRCDLGRYLSARLAALEHTTSEFFKIATVSAKANALTQDTDGWWIVAENTEHGPFDEVLLTVGQPRTDLDPQLRRWTEHAKTNDLDLMSAYPGTDLLKAAKNWAGKTVAVRGLGLSTHDVLRLLTIGQSGRFEEGRYIRSGNEPRKILPFSLDGTPPAPKPATADIDAQFDLLDAEIDSFRNALTIAVAQSAKHALHTICDALLAPTFRIVTKCGGTCTEDGIRNWLDSECSNPGSQDTQDTLAALRLTIKMAHAQVPPSEGYVIGQIWRKLQNDIRKGVNSAEMPSETAAAIIGFDEGLKRYSYGPPVSASEQLLALINDGLVSLQAVADPDIVQDKSGWRLIEGKDELLAQVMIDAVLPSPHLDHVSDPLIKDGIAQGRMSMVKGVHGAKTRADGQLLGPDGSVSAGLSLLGRLAHGSVIAADSLHDCLGDTAQRWAKGVSNRNF